MQLEIDVAVRGDQLNKALLLWRPIGRLGGLVHRSNGHRSGCEGYRGALSTARLDVRSVSVQSFL